MKMPCFFALFAFIPLYGFITGGRNIVLDQLSTKHDWDECRTVLPAQAQSMVKSLPEAGWMKWTLQNPSVCNIQQGILWHCVCRYKKQ